MCVPEYFHGNHVNPKKVSELVEGVFDKKNAFRSSKIKDMFVLDKRIKEEVESACRSANLLAEESLEKAISYLREEFGYCEPCAQAALEYFVGKV